MKINITHQGAPIVNDGYVYRKGKDIVAMYVDLVSKYCGAALFGSTAEKIPTIAICAEERSLHLDETKDHDSFTWIEFPEYAGWSVFEAGVSKYELSVCLTCDNVDDEE